MMKQCLLSTIDNPFNPFDDFDSWFSFDTEKGYNCSNRLARIAKVTEDMSSVEELVETERAIDEIILNDPIGIYIKVTKELVEEAENMSTSTNSP